MLFVVLIYGLCLFLTVIAIKIEKKDYTLRKEITREVSTHYEGKRSTKKTYYIAKED